MNAQELKEKILEWESEIAESFVDYFAHDAVHPPSFAFWLIGKGYSEHGNYIISEYLASETHYVEQDMFEVYPQYIGEDFSQENFEKNIELLAEFLSATPFYTEKTLQFFEENKEE